jgi:hypothetical protein
MACGTAVTLSADKDNLSDVAKRIVTALTLAPKAEVVGETPPVMAVAAPVGVVATELPKTGGSTSVSEPVAPASLSPLPSFSESVAPASVPPSPAEVGEVGRQPEISMGVGVMLLVVWPGIILILIVGDGLVRYAQGFVVGVLSLLVAFTSGLFLPHLYLQWRRSPTPEAETRLRIMSRALFVSGLACLIGFSDAYIPQPISPSGEEAPFIFLPLMVGIALVWNGVRMVKARLRATS